MSDVAKLGEWLDDVVQALAKRPLMYVNSESYDVYCAYIVGFGIGRDDGVFAAWTDWLAGRQPRYKNYAMPAMVLAEANLHSLGDTERVSLSAEDDAVARAVLLDLLREFLGGE